jgi:hypothetical protein
MTMIVALVLIFVVMMYAIRSQYDFTLNGKAGWFSFFFQAQDRKSRTRRELSHTEKTPVVVKALLPSDSETPR